MRLQILTALAAASVSLAPPAHADRAPPLVVSIDVAGMTAETDRARLQRQFVFLARQQCGRRGDYRESGHASEIERAACLASLQVDAPAGSWVARTFADAVKIAGR